MDNIFIDMRKQGKTLENFFKGDDLVTLDEILDKFEEIIDELEHLKEEFEDYKQCVKDNYKPLTTAELVGVYDSDFI